MRLRKSGSSTTPPFAFFSLEDIARQLLFPFSLLERNESERKDAVSFSLRRTPQQLTTAVLSFPLGQESKRRLRLFFHWTSVFFVWIMNGHFVFSPPPFPFYPLLSMRTEARDFFFAPGENAGRLFSPSSPGGRKDWRLPPSLQAGEEVCSSVQRPFLIFPPPSTGKSVEAFRVVR